MCLEVYSVDQPIQVPFVHETIRFLALDRFLARHILLLRNVGYRPIPLLSVLFPCPIYRLAPGPDEASPMEVSLAGLVDATHQLPHFGDFFGRPAGGRLGARLADPNNPLRDMPGLMGVWDPGGAEPVLPHGLTRRCFLLLEADRFTAWCVRLRRPIEAGDAQWFCWEILVEGAGELLPDSLGGPMAFHELSSPANVRRTLVAGLRRALRTHHEHGPEAAENSEHEVTLRRILHSLGLQFERQVETQYHELSVQPGNPLEHLLVSHSHEGDIRQRPGTPRVGRHPILDQEFLGEPVYEWQSGSFITQGDSSGDSNFNIRLTLAGKRPSRKRRNA